MNELLDGGSTPPSSTIFIRKVTALYVAKVIYNAVIFNKDAYVDLTTRNRI